MSKTTEAQRFVAQRRTAYIKTFETPFGEEVLADLAKFPFTTKSDLRDSYPFGMFAVPREQCARIHASSGTTGKPTVVALNMVDLAERDGLVIDPAALASELGVPVISTVAVRRRGLSELAEAIAQALGNTEVHPHAMDRANIPGCTYCHPQVASVGLTEAKAELEERIELLVLRHPEPGLGDRLLDRGGEFGDHARVRAVEGLDQRRHPPPAALTEIRPERPVAYLGRAPTGSERFAGL